MKKNQLDLHLLPKRYKIVAYVLIIISLIFLGLFKLDLFSLDKQIAKTILSATFLISFLILAISKDNIEDELSIRIRLLGFTSAFIFGVGIIIVEPFINLIFGDNFSINKSPFELLLSMFIFYFLTIEITKRRL